MLDKVIQCRLHIVFELEHIGAGPEVVLEDGVEGDLRARIARAKRRWCGYKPAYLEGVLAIGHPDPFTAVVLNAVEESGDCDGTSRDPEAPPIQALQPPGFLVDELTSRFRRHLAGLSDIDREDVPRLRLTGIPRGADGNDLDCFKPSEVPQQSWLKKALQLGHGGGPCSFGASMRPSVPPRHSICVAQQHPQVVSNHACHVHRWQAMQAGQCFYDGP